MQIGVGNCQWQYPHHTYIFGIAPPTGFRCDPAAALLPPQPSGSPHNREGANLEPLVRHAGCGGNASILKNGEEFLWAMSKNKNVLTTDPAIKMARLANCICSPSRKDSSNLLCLHIFFILYVPLERTHRRGWLASDSSLLVHGSQKPKSQKVQHLAPIDEGRF